MQHILCRGDRSQRNIGLVIRAAEGILKATLVTWLDINLQPLNQASLNLCLTTVSIPYYRCLVCITTVLEGITRLINDLNSGTHSLYCCILERLFLLLMYSLSYIRTTCRFLFCFSCYFMKAVGVKGMGGVNLSVHLND